MKNLKAQPLQKDQPASKQSHRPGLRTLTVCSTTSVTRSLRKKSGLRPAAKSSSTRNVHFQLASQIDIVATQDLKRIKLHPSSTLVSSIQVNSQNQTNFVLSPTEDLNDTPYLVIRSLKGNGIQKGYTMQLGDIVKLGRMQFEVLEYRDDSRVYNLRQTNLLTLDQYSTFTAPSAIQTGTCKICLSDQFTDDNYLCSPCNCKGSCQMVHLQCLKMWINSKIKKQPNGISTQYNFTKFKCELCSQAFPQRVIKNGVQTLMIKIQKPSKPYIILQSLTQGKAQGQKILHLISQPVEGQSIKLGRNHSCQIRMTDISVSRIHAHIKYLNKRFVLFDNQSKFGTLVRLNKVIRFKPQQIALQIGRTVVAMSLRFDNSMNYGVPFYNKPGSISSNRILHRK